MRAEEEESRKRAEAEARERAEEPERLEAEAKRRAEEKKRRRRAEAAARQRAGEPERLEAEAKRREEQVQVFEAAKRASPIRMLAIAAGMAFTAGVIGLIIYTNTPPQAPEPTVQAPQPAPVPSLADDLVTCQKASGDERISACSRAIASGSIGNDDLVSAYVRRGKVLREDAFGTEGLRCASSEPLLAPLC
jgi:dTMP kinase